MNAPVRSTSTLAVVSLVFGILGWSLLPAIGSVVAVITGHLARSEIRNAQGGMEGDGMAVAGLVLGYAMLALSIVGIVLGLLFFGGLIWLGLTS
jgi:hypothetical protein